MKKIFLLSISLATFVPQHVLAHNDPKHSEETIFQQIFNLDHLFFYFLPTAILASLLIKNKNKIVKFFKTKKIK